MPATPSRASIFFQKIEDLGSSAAYDHVANLGKKSSQTEENEWREFKQGGFLRALNGPSVKHRQETDRQLKAIWSECLGAFANSAGGILIWGIKAPRKIADGIDLVPDPKALQDRLTVLASDAVDPPILGVQVVALTVKTSPSGFVVCYIPQSDFPPHRSLWAQREYYFRTQDGNRPMPTAVLRRMFYPQNFPMVVPVAKAFIALGGDESFHLQMSIDLNNRGSASAEDIAIHFMPVDQRCETWYDTNKWSRDARPDGFYFRGHTTIHPDETFPWLRNCTSDIRNWKEEGKMLMFKFRIFARNTAARSFVLSFSAAELAAQPNVPIKREAVDEA
jgi:Putative DNA-binding domain